jgi:hypothetical protein
MSKPYTLRLYNSVLQGTGFAADISDAAANWKRNIRALGGFWQGSFTLNANTAEMAQAFQTWLGWHVQEHSAGNVTWEGMIYEMEFEQGGVKRRRSLDLMSNAIRATYTDPTTNAATTLAYTTQDQSIARYGRRENTLVVGTLTTASATAQRDTALKENAWPWARPVSLSLKNAKPVLTVKVCGYVFTLNWEYTSVQDGATGNVSTFINDIIVADCPFVSVGVIRTNTLQVKRATALTNRAWDTLRDQVVFGDASGNPWRLYVDVGRKVYYEQIVTTPKYYLFDGGLRSSIGESVGVFPWLVRPAVVRDSTYPVTRAETGSFLSDARDMWIPEVEVDAHGNIMPKTDLFDEGDILAAQAKLEQERLSAKPTVTQVQPAEQRMPDPKDRED